MSDYGYNENYEPEKKGMGIGGVLLLTAVVLGTTMTGGYFIRKRMQTAEEKEEALKNLEKTNKAKEEAKKAEEEADEKTKKDKMTNEKKSKKKRLVEIDDLIEFKTASIKANKTELDAQKKIATPNKIVINVLDNTVKEDEKKLKEFEKEKDNIEKFLKDN